MEGNGEISFGVTVSKGDEAPDSYRLAPRIEIPRQPDGPTAATPAAPVVAAAAGLAVQGSSQDPMKKKRGRPRKYGPNGVALSPMPISASIPLAGDYASWEQRSGSGARPVKKIKKKPKFLLDSQGDKIALFVGANFTPHIITINPGEDITMKVMSFSQQGARAICILSANGTISNVTLRQPTSSGGTLTYEGRFEILSLSGSYTPTENRGTMSSSGRMSVSLAGPDGHVLGGGIAGLLVAAGPVQVVLASFLPGHQLEPKPKKRRIEHAPVLTQTAAVNNAGGVQQSATYNGENSTHPLTQNKAAFTIEEANGFS